MPMKCYTHETLTADEHLRTSALRIRAPTSKEENVAKPMRLALSAHWAAKQTGSLSN